MSLSDLENRLGHKFRDPSLLERALTHRSWVYENLSGSHESELCLAENGSLEFVGDSVLGLVVVDELFRRHPDLAEGGLTVMKHQLVSMPTLAHVGESLGLGEFLRMGKGEDRSGGRAKQAILADTFEAVIAAVFLDGGYSAARAFVTNVLATELRDATPEAAVDYKSLLQERLQATGREAPNYTVVTTEGPPHARTFFVEAAWQGGAARGEGRSIKAAEMAAARDALEMLGEDGPK